MARIETALERPAELRFRVLASMLRPIVTLLLRHGVGIGELLEAGKRAYVDAAIAEVIPLGRRPNVSRLSVVTGLTRKEVAKVLQTSKAGKSLIAKRTTQQRALRVLRGWLLDPHFARADGKPAALSLLQGRSSFPALVRKYGGDVTPVAVLRELERMHVVTKTRAGKLRMASSSVLRGLDPEVLEFAQLVEDFADSITDRGDNERTPVFRGFREANLESSDQISLFKTTFAKRGVALLEGVDEWVASHDTANQPRVRVGMGVYIVEKSAHGRHRRRRPDAARD